jgi:hypothetical protein
LFGPDHWGVLGVTYFSSLLLPMIWLTRKLKNWRGKAATHDLKFGPPLVDAVLLGIFRLERPWLRRASFPLGSSLMLVVRKR